jgi:ATP-binding cassette subfamily C protein LapB
MDNGSERQLIARLGEFLPGRTLVLITHRASLLVLVERIVVVDRGKVVADGRRDEILRQLNSGEIRVTEG